MSIMKKMPRQGEIDSLFRRLDQFISQYDSHWKDQIEGISDEEMNHLKSVCKIDERGIDYPKDYLVYLKYMGKKDDGLLGWGLSGKVDTNYSVILEDLGYWFEEIEEFNEEEKSSFLIGFNHEVGEDYFIYYYDRPSYVICGGGFGAIISTSIEKFLFQNAFMKYEEQMETYAKGVYCKPLKYSQRDLYKEFKGDADALFQYLVEQEESFFLEIHKICTRYQMERLWISDVANVFYYGSRGSFWMHSSGKSDGDFYGKIASDNKEFVRTVMSAIKKIKGYKISDWD